MRVQFLLALPLALAACDSTPAEKAPVAHDVRGERLAIGMRSLPDTSEVPATVTTRDMAEARARIPGVLASLRVRAGDRVTAGQPIAVIEDSRLAQESLAQGAGVTAAAAQAARAQADLERIRLLHREGVYAQSRLDEALAASRSADAMLSAARAQQGAVRAAEGQGVVRAPAAGTVLVVDLPQGSAVAPGVVVATITAGPPVVRLDVPEGLGKHVADGMAVRIAGLAGRQAGETVSGRIARTYPGVQAGRRRADVVVPGLAPELVGQRVTAEVVLGGRQGIAVPGRFVQQRFGLNFVRLLSADGKRAYDVPVEVRTLAGGDVELLSGVKPGDVVVLPAGQGR